MTGSGSRAAQARGLALSVLLLASAVTGGIAVVADEAAAKHNDSRIRDVEIVNAVDEDDDGYVSSFDVRIDAQTALHNWDPFTPDPTGEPRFVVKINGQQVYAHTYSYRNRFYTIDLSEEDWSGFDRDSSMRVTVEFLDDDGASWLHDPVDEESEWVDFEPPSEDEPGDLDVTVVQDGSTVEDASLSLWDGGDGEYAGDEIVRETGWDGTAEFPVLEPSAYQLEVWKDGDFWGAPTYEVGGGGTTEVTFDRRAPHVTDVSVDEADPGESISDGDGILEPTDTIEISADVRNDEGYAKDVEVTFDVEGQGTLTVETTIDANSAETVTRSYFFDDPGTYDYSITVETEYGDLVRTDHTDASSFTLEAGPSIEREGDADVTVERGEPVTFAVHATDPSNNLDGVRWAVGDSPPEHTSEVSGGSADASWTTSFQSTDTYTVSATAFDTGDQYSGDAEWTVEVTERTGTVEATVVEDGDPVSDATVYLLTDDGRSKDTGGDGSVTFDDVPLGEHNLAYHVDGQHRGGASVTVDGTGTQVELSRVAPLVTDVAVDDDNGDGDGTFELGEPVTVSPTVYNDESAGHPVRTLISVRGPDGSLASNPHGVTLDREQRGPITIDADSAGYFGVDVAVETPGTYEVKVVTQTDYGGGWVKTDETGWRTAFTAEPATLSGTVTAEGSGNPVDGATVRVDGATATTGDDGTYAVAVDSLGDHSLSVDAGGFESASRRVHVDSPDATADVALEGEPVDVYFTVSKRSTVDGYSFDGEPIEGATLTVDGDEYTTDAEGDVDLQLPPGTYEYTAEAEGYETLTGEVTVHPASTSVVSVPLVRTGVGVLDVEVVGADGDPLGGNTYRVMVDGEEVEPDADGELLLEEGTHAVRIQPTEFGEGEGLAPVEREVTVEAGKRIAETFRPTGEAVSIAASRDTTVTGSPISLRATYSGEGTVETYKWTVVDVPDGDDGVPAAPDRHDRRTTSFRPEAPGEYRLAVTVTTAAGGEYTAFRTVTVEERSSLIEEYAPILHFHPEETYFPTRFEAYVRNADLHDGDRTVEDPTLWDLADASPDAHLSLEGDESDYPTYEHHYPRTVYASVHPEVTFRGEQYTAVTYWLFYVYDPKDGSVAGVAQHPTDTETVTVLVQDGEAEWLGASQHKDGERREWSEVDATGTHPHVYPALGAHSNYLRNTSRYAGEGVVLDAEFLGVPTPFDATTDDEGGDATTTEGVSTQDVLPDSLTDVTGGGETWSPDGSVGSAYEIAVLTGEEPWQDYPGSLMPESTRLETIYGKAPPPAGRERWRDPGEWLAGIRSDEAYLDATFASLAATGDRTVTATLDRPGTKPQTVWVTAEAKPADASWDGDRVHATTERVRLGTTVNPLAAREVTLEPVPTSATGEWEVRTTVRAAPPSVADADEDLGTRTVTLGDDPDQPDDPDSPEESDFSMRVDTNVTGLNRDESTPTSPYLAVEVEVEGAHEAFAASNLSLTYRRPGFWWNESATFYGTGSGEYVAYVPYKLGNVTYTVTADDRGEAHEYSREQLVRPVAFSTDDYYGVYYGSEPVSKDTLEKIEDKGVSLALKKTAQVSFGSLLAKLGVAGGKTISKKVFVLGSFIAKFIPQNGYGFSSSYADVYLAAESPGSEPGFDAEKTAVEGDGVYPIFHAFADLKDPLWTDHSLSARFVAADTGEVAATYETELRHPYGRGEYVVIPKEPVAAPPADGDDARTYAVDPEYRVGEGANATLYTIPAAESDDIAPSIGTVTPGDGAVVPSAADVVVEYADDGSGVDTRDVTVTVDGEPVGVDAGATRATGSLAGLDLSGGTHTLAVSVYDVAGNERTRETTFTVDAGPPAVDLALDASTTAPASPVGIEATVTDATLETADLRIVDASTGETVAAWSLDAGHERVVWNGVADGSGAVPDGTYAVRVDATDALGQSATAERQVTVETEPPDVSLASVATGDASAGAHAGEVVTTDGAVTVSGSVERGTAPVEEVTVTLSAAFANYEYATTATVEDGSWSATVDAANLPDDGAYLVSATATGTRGLSATRTGTTTVDVDRDAPTVTARVVPAGGALDRVVVTSDEALDGPPTLTVDQPNGATRTVDLTPDGDRRWTGTFPMAQPGAYELTVRGTDEAGNADERTVTSTVRTQFSPGPDGTITVGGQASDAFAVLRPEGDAWTGLGQSDYAALNSLDASPVDLTGGRTGAGFLAGELSADLSDALGTATLAIPVEAERIPAGQSAADLDVHYYDEAAGEWEPLDTDVETRTVPGGDTQRRYWVADVTHFSVYGVVASDDSPPELEAAGPSGDLPTGTTEATVAFEYADDGSGVDAGEVSLSLDGRDVTDAAAATITGDRATYDATGLAAGEHEATVTVVDEAGNERQFTTTFTVELADATPPTASFEAPRDGVTLPDGTDRTTLVTTYDDDGSGVATDEVTLAVDGQDVTDEATVTADGVEYTATGLDAGTHTATLSVADAANNVETATVEFTIPGAGEGGDGGTGSGGDGDGNGGGGGGGCGGGGSAGPPEPPVRTQLTEVTPAGFTAEITSARADAPGRIAPEGGVSAGDLGVREVTVTPKSAEATARFFVSGQVTESVPAGAPGVPAGTTLGVANVSAKYISDSKLAAVGVAFAVPADAVAAPENVAIYRLDAGSWRELETSVASASGGTYVVRATASATGTFAVGATGGDLSVASATVEAGEVEAGATVPVTATVENTGDGTGVATLELAVDGTVVTEKRVTLDAGESRTVTFAVTLDAAGEHEVAVAGVDAGSVAVRGQATTAGGSGGSDGDAGGSDGAAGDGDTGGATTAGGSGGSTAGTTDSDGGGGPGLGFAPTLALAVVLVALLFGLRRY